MRQTFVQATRRAHLKTLLTISGGIVFTTIPKFYLADEAHRSQYGFTGKLDATDEQLEKEKRRDGQLNAIVGNFDRLRDIAYNIVGHEARLSA